MAAFDTSGGVGPMPGWYKPVPTSNRFIFWEDLSPFAQGYVEALWRAFCDDENDRRSEMRGHVNRSIPAEKDYGFSDLAPEALDMILRDCEALAAAVSSPSYNNRNSRIMGEGCWEARQKREPAYAARGFPPLRISLNEDGKVALELL